MLAVVPSLAHGARRTGNTHLLQQSLQRLIGDLATDLAAGSHADKDFLNLLSELRTSERYPRD